MTDAELIRRLTNAYRIAYVDAVKEYQRLWDLIDDVSTGKKQPPAFYDTPEKIAKWKQGFIRSQFRQENVIHQIAKKLAEVGVDMRSEIKSYIHDVYRYNRELAIGGIKRAVNINFDQYDKRQIDILLDDEQPVFSKIAYRNLGRDGKIVERLQREFAAGIINGDDKTKMLKRVQKVTGQSRYQAWRVAQTERTRVSSQARDRVINEAAAQGVIVLKEWSTRMRNSREAHISLDGQRVASGEVFHVNPENDVISRSKKNGVRLGTGYDIAYPGDPSAPARAVCNCYCVLIPRVQKNGTQTATQIQPQVPQNVVLQATQQPQNVVQSTAKSEFVVQTLPQSGIAPRNVEPLPRVLTDEEIISRVGGADQTSGSCSSLALTYAANKAGMNVLDFRGGTSCTIFSRGVNVKEIAQFEGVDGIITKDYNAFKAADEALRNVESGKQYYFSAASHAAIVRKTDSGFEYLELQAGNEGRYTDGWYKLTNDILKYRFGAKKSRSSYGMKLTFSSVLMDVEKLGQSADFREMMKYINTAENAQKKGVGGGIK